MLIQTQNDIKQNILLLKQLLQLPSSNLFDIEVPTNIDMSGSLASLHEVQVNAIANFPEIKIGKLDMDIALLDIAKAKAGFKPVLTANASIGSGYSNMLTNVYYSKINYFVQTGNNFYQRVGISLTIPIFSNRINKTNLAKANIGYNQAKLDLQNYQLILSQAIEQVYLNTLNAQQAYVAANEQLTAAAESYRIIQAQFKLGGTNTYEVLQLRNQYVQAIQAYTQTKYTAVLQQKIYEFYLGKPITF